MNPRQGQPPTPAGASGGETAIEASAEAPGESGAGEPAADVGALVFGAADGDRGAWEALVTAHRALVASITTAHRLTDADADEVWAAVWHRLEHNLHKLRQPDQVGAWLAAVTRDECVKVLTI